MKKKKTKKQKQEQKPPQDVEAHRNRPIHLPLDFEKAVVGLMKVRPKKSQEPS
jgi:hypothetical protein